MTLVSIWNDAERIWCAADTKISNGQTMLTERGTKILPITMNCFGPSGAGFFNKVILRRTFGASYAGSTLVAHLTLDTLSAAIGNLVCLEGENLPSIMDIGKLAARILESYVKEVGVSNPNVKTEIALVGACPQLNKRTVLHITIKNEDNGLSANAEVIHPTTEVPHLMGDEEAKKVYCEADDSDFLQPVPLARLEHLIQQDRIRSVGGTCQVGCLVGVDFQIFALARPVERGKSEATMRFVGFDLFNEIGAVGPCQVGMYGFAGGGGKR